MSDRGEALCELEVPLVLAIEDEVLFYVQGVALLDHDIMLSVSKSRVVRIRISV
ncbi:hypothetical protein H5T55_05925 [Candidatus Bipolaricaulota bacterium]|nr:hypothetical protein [Candidatus Bipolaricaulota bacterium]